MIPTWLSTLNEHFGPPKAPVSYSEVQHAFTQDGLSGVVRKVKQDLKITCKVTLDKDQSNLRKHAFAWIRLPESMPPYGTQAFIDTQVVIFVSPKLQSSKDQRVVTFAIAHEFAHVILDSNGHTHRHNEKVVDLTAMWLGYAEFFQHHRKNNVEQVSPKNFMQWFKYFCGVRYITKHQVGYLTDEEIEEATKIIQQLR
jgi:predicted SprT family Zn-dependent metalloprotease